VKIGACPAFGSANDIFHTEAHKNAKEFILKNFALFACFGVIELSLDRQRAEPT
jgi:hypothetical protein